MATEPLPALSRLRYQYSINQALKLQDALALYRPSDRFLVLSERLVEGWRSRLWKEGGRKRRSIGLAPITLQKCLGHKLTALQRLGPFTITRDAKSRARVGGSGVVLHCGSSGAEDYVVLRLGQTNEWEA